MKFKRKEIPRAGQIRIRTKFLWWPKLVDLEWWWLERVVITEIMCESGGTIYEDLDFRWEETYVETVQEYHRKEDDDED